MSFEEFVNSLGSATPPAQLSGYLKSLWYDAKNDWQKSHEIAQDINDQRGSQIHAYLHRKEGDPSNANYWYRKAGKSMPYYSLEQEWKEIVVDCLTGI
jgi:hypothetical protein